MRVGLADDALLFREGLARLIEDLGFEVVFQAGTVEELERAMEAVIPDAVIVDVRMPPTYTSEGIVAARRLRARHPGLGVLVLSQYVESSEASRLLAEDGRGVGYLLKDRVSDLDTLSDAVHRVAAGGTVIDPEVVSRLLARRNEGEALAGLTPREREVLALMAEGHSNTAIGERLFIGGKTVETHIGTIFSKLELFPDHEVDRRVRAVLAFLRTSARSGRDPHHGATPGRRPPLADYDAGHGTEPPRARSDAAPRRRAPGAGGADDRPPRHRVRRTAARDQRRPRRADRDA